MINKIKIKYKNSFITEIYANKVNHDDLIYNYIKTEKFNNNTNILLFSNGKLLNRNTKFINLFENDDKMGNIVEVIPIMMGGGILDVFYAIAEIGKFFIKLPILIGDIIKVGWWFIELIFWFITMIHPSRLFSDFFNSVVMIVNGIFNGIIQVIMGFIEFGVNMVGGWTQGFWGWDQSNLTKNDLNSNYFKKQNECGNRKCYLTRENTIPFSVILGTVVCPPLGVFMEYGVLGWAHILICLGLTFLYYIPGLLYALLIIYT